MISQTQSAQSLAFHQKIDWQNPTIPQACLCFWGYSLDYNKIIELKRFIIQSYNDKQCFSLLIVKNPEGAPKSDLHENIANTIINLLLEDVKIRKVFSSRYFLGFVFWDDILKSPEFESLKVWVKSLQSKKMRKLIKKENEFSDAQMNFLQEKMKNKEEFELILMQVFMERKEPGFKSIVYLNLKIRESVPFLTKLADSVVILTTGVMLGQIVVKSGLCGYIHPKNLCNNLGNVLGYVKKIFCCLNN